MPTDAKRQSVAELAEAFEKATVAVAADFSGMPVNQMTQLRRRLRENGAEFRVVKNRIALLAAAQADSDLYPSLLAGVTGLAVGYGDPMPVVKALDGYVKESRASLTVRNAIVDGRLYTAAEVAALATVPPREELLARLLGQMNAPVARLAGALNSTIGQLAVVLARRAEQLQPTGAP